MTSNELRIGNWVNGGLNGDLFYRIKPSDFVNTNFELTRPIPLTPEILGKAGFTKDKMWPYRLPPIELSHTTTEEHFEFEYKTPYLEWQIIPVKFVHQLQNLYFALTGEELPIVL